MSLSISRRRALTAAAGIGAGALVQRPAAADDDAAWRVARGRVRQSVVHWCFKPIDVQPLAKAAAALGLQSVELVEPRHWSALKDLGLVCAIAPSHGFVRGLNRVEHHAECTEKIGQAIDAAAAGGCPSVITFSGMRQGLSDEEGIRNTVAGVKKVIGQAERKGVNLCLEMLNSRVNEEMKGHPDYQCDSIEWAVKVCERVGSPRMKILFDIYHVQIMQGDVIARIRQFHQHIGHYHTAGVPGRGELDDNQEINYPAIMRAIVDTGYRGFVGQEFIPRAADKIASLRAAARLCDV